MKSILDCEPLTVFIFLMIFVGSLLCVFFVFKVVFFGSKTTIVNWLYALSFLVMGIAIPYYVRN